MDNRADLSRALLGGFLEELISQLVPGEPDDLSHVVVIDAIDDVGVQWEALLASLDSLRIELHSVDLPDFDGSAAEAFADVNVLDSLLENVQRACEAARSRIDGARDVLSSAYQRSRRFIDDTSESAMRKLRSSPTAIIRLTKVIRARLRSLTAIVQSQWLRLVRLLRLSEISLGFGLPGAAEITFSWDVANTRGSPNRSP